MHSSNACTCVRRSGEGCSEEGARTETAGTRVNLSLRMLSEAELLIKVHGSHQKSGGAHLCAR